ncbi:hypothetical protein PsYK624_099430 [Phanerochaete sordida]|uniref:BTB domain-containing protein n=1 Tax=Phanerochaete sordida TaxID=48140 RepID=A0A9P3GFA9_9APHY|nr:hypothetical protein PsYK624_099430 [Phanerochaete sordida]
MSVLHTYFHRRDQQAFQRAIDAAIRASSHSSSGAPSSSLGRSLSGSPPAHASGSAVLDINARDGLGRTVLHLACSSAHASAPTYVRLVLAHPHVQVNAPDAESHWTPLHRALYAGNVAAALLLLQRPDVDVHAKDWEGYTPYDVWNSSIEGTKPDAPLRRDAEADEDDEIDAELYVWGSNRNAGLGVGDADDRAFPELVQFDRDRDQQSRAGGTISDRFRAVKVRGVGMARFHTAIVTSESRTNVRVCGFGSGARLGSGIYTTTYTPTTLAGLPTSSSASSSGYTTPARPPITSRSLSSSSSKSRTSLSDPQRIVAVAAGQDHTLMLTAAGEVWSWGNNRSSVLGYVIDPTDESYECASTDKKGAEKAAWQDKSDATLLQPSPRKVQGQLKGRHVRAISACRTASACVTEDGEVLTWGVNNGQLGYDRVAHPVQILPRIVTKVSQPVLEVTITDTSTALLLNTHDVLLLHANGSHRLAFPALAFPNTIAAYRPPQAARNAAIDKVVATELAASASAGARESAMFAALSRNGELFTWVVAAPEPAGAAAKERDRGERDRGEKDRERERREVVRPQRVWALRKKFSAVRDVALGADGSIVVCTEAGHVFLRSRSPASSASAAPADEGGAGKAFKFARVPCLQRVVRVYANSTGAFAALRVDARVDEVCVEGRTLREEIEGVVPWFGPPADGRRQGREAVSVLGVGVRVDGDEDGDGERERPRDVEDGEDDPAVLRDQVALAALLMLLDTHAQAVKASRALPGEAPLPSPLSGTSEGAHGADLLVHVLGGTEPRIPAHRAILGARSAVLRAVLAGKACEVKVSGGAAIRIALAKDKEKDKERERRSDDGSHPCPWRTPARLTVAGAHPLSVLLLLRYLYADDLVAVWDWRIGGAPALTPAFARLKVRPAQLKTELQALADALALPAMAAALEGAFRRDVAPTLARDLGAVAAEVCEADVREVEERDALRPDVVLLLADREVPAHGAVLRARSPFFAAFFGEPAWTARRWTPERTIRVDLRHMRWREVQYVLRYLYGAEEEVFDDMEDVGSADELVDAVFGVMAVANELLLDRMVLLCSRIIQQRITIANATFILADASLFHATALVQSVQAYIARNLETLLEHRLLDALPPDLVKQLAAAVRAAQARKAPVARTGALAAAALARHAAWAAQQDWPSPVVRSAQPRPPPVRTRPAPEPARPAEKRRGVVEVVDDEVFMMDGVDAIPPLSLSAPVQPARAAPVVGGAPEKVGGWKVPGAAPKADMKAIMAETAASGSRPAPASSSVPRSSAASEAANWRTPQRKTSATLLADSAARTPAGGSPWKPVPSVSSAALAAGGSPVQTPPMTPTMRATRTRDEGPPAPRPGMGPVFAPSRQAAKQKGTASPMRRTASNAAAWTLPPVQPSVQPSPAPAAAPSFVAIQELQREQGGRGKARTRSLKEIQAEEAARRVEEEFLEWWAAEEVRLRAEEAGAAPLAASAEAGAARKPKGRRREGAKDGARKPAGDGTRKPAGEGAKERKDVAGPAEGSAPNTPRRRRRPGPGTNSKAEGAQAKTE